MQVLSLDIDSSILAIDDKKIFAIEVIQQVVRSHRGKHTTLSTHRHILTPEQFEKRFVNQPEIVKATKEQALKLVGYTCDPTPFMQYDDSKKPHWMHLRNDEQKVHCCVCSVCRVTPCKCEPGKGAPPKEHPHGLDGKQKFVCKLPAYE